MDRKLHVISTDYYEWTDEMHVRQRRNTCVVGSKIEVIDSALGTKTTCKVKRVLDDGAALLVVNPDDELDWRVITTASVRRSVWQNKRYVVINSTEVKK